MGNLFSIYLHNPAAATFTLAAGMAVVAVSLVAYATVPNGEIAKPKFAIGDYVRLSVSGERGRIYNGWCTRSGCHYDVRFSVDARLGNVREHELESAR